MKRLSLFFTLMFIASSLFSQERGAVPVKVSAAGTTILYKQSHALVIGMSKYTNGWPTLSGVEKDLIDVEATLKKNGFHVVVKRDKTRAELDKVFMDFITQYGQEKENRLLFYFAGHGHTLTNFGEINGYIVPIDAPNPNYNESGFIAKAMPMSRIEEYAKQSKSKHALFLFDACFSGSLFSVNRAIPEIISYKTAQPVRQFITSGSAEETVPDKSIFREQFVQALTTDYADANKDGYLTGTELGKFLQDNVVNYSRNTQHPQYGKIRNTYLDKGDFVFVLNPSNNLSKNINVFNINEEDILPLISKGNLNISNYLQGSLYIDDKYKQLANKNKLIKLENLPIGKHTIKIVSSNETWQKSVIIYENQTASLIAKNISKRSFNGIERIYVEGGSFTMGSSAGNGNNDEYPEHFVTVNSFYISKYEITNAQYADFMNAKGVNPNGSIDEIEYLEMDDADVQISYTGGQFIVDSNKENFPVIEVSWYGAKAYAEYYGGRLPTEAEWEFAARGGNSAANTTYSGSTKVDKVAWYYDNSGSTTHPVGAKYANELGIYDMNGNVWEWCNDWYDADYYKKSNSDNPQGSNAGNECVLRGGSWDSKANSCRVAKRSNGYPTISGSGLGFRPVFQ